MAIPFELMDKYNRTDGVVLLTGIQALVRVPMDQARLDLAAGRKTGTFITGYPGSPLGVFDKALADARSLLSQYDIVHQPAVNEELGAVAVWGSQQTPRPYSEGRTGVVGIWYGKAPGVDRSGDSFRHGNYMGVHAGGGVLALAGDDPSAKSSTLPTDSQSAFYDLAFPIIVPSSIQDVLDLGLYGISLSRFSGNWVAMKMVTNLCDGLATVEVHTKREFVTPVVEINGLPWRHRQRSSVLTPISLDQETELFGARLAAAKAHLEANGVNRVVRRSANDRLGIVSYGKPFVDFTEALAQLATKTDLPPIRILKLGASYPLPERTIREFADGLAEILVIEEKRSFVETQIKEVLYASTARPSVLGKLDRGGKPLVPATGELNQDRIGKLLRAWLQAHVPGLEPGVERTRIELPVAQATATAQRPAAYCSGCPHSRSTVVPSGALIGGGCGCHSMIYTEPRHKHDDLFSVVPMGTEGAEWIGLAPFVETPHMFQNLGDGTYFHSGINAVRACIDAGVNITFKLLFNSAIAMTGGQSVPGSHGVQSLTRELEAMGVIRTIVCTDDTRKYRRGAVADNVTIRPREYLDRAQDELASTRGVTVLLFDQYCAAEARRLRKRGAMPTPPARVVINERVCEGCGDCQTKSNCLSVIPVSTELGRKTQIHNPSCNRDYSCLTGDCPSFVTVLPRRATRHAGRQRVEVPVVDEPRNRAAVPDDPARSYSLVLAGIGGTGVMTANQILAVAAMLDGYSCVGLDQTGLSQKAGPVLSHLRISRGPVALPGAVARGAADALLAFDAIVAVSEPALAGLNATRTASIVNSDIAPTRDMIVEASMRDGVDLEVLVNRIARACAPGRTSTIAATSLSESIFDDNMPANLLMVGAAYQAGLIPLTADSIRAAIRANGVSVDKNLAAFEWGRKSQAAPELQSEASRLGMLPMNPISKAKEQAAQLTKQLDLPDRLRDRVAEFAAELIDYGGAKVAGRYLSLVALAVRSEQSEGPQAGDFSMAVANNFFKVLAYKDEYEVARLMLIERFRADIADQVGPATVYYHLHPPLLRAFGLSRKIRIRSTWAVPLFTVLRALRPLRSTPFDPFGYTKIRRRERRFIDDYERAVVQATNFLAESPDKALAVAMLPESVRGYESIKDVALDDFYRSLETIGRPSGTDRQPVAVAGS